MRDWKFKVIARNGKTLGATMTEQEAKDMVEFYDRDSDYKPCHYLEIFSFNGTKY